MSDVLVYQAEVAGSNATSLYELWQLLNRRRFLFSGTLSGLLLLCLIYCAIVPRQYEASAQVALRTSSEFSLISGKQESFGAASALSPPLQLETIANVLRSDQLAWRVIASLKLYQASGFMGDFSSLFPNFKSEASQAAAQDWLLERFQRRLSVQTLPGTYVIQIRFRSHSAALSASVVNELIRAYNIRESEAGTTATGTASVWLAGQLQQMKARADADRERLEKFQSDHGLLNTPETLANGQVGESQHAPALIAVDELERQMVIATSDRIQRESEYYSAQAGDPELAVSVNPHSQTESSGLILSALGKIQAKKSDLEQELAQLSAEHGSNYPRVVEIHHELNDLQEQRTSQDKKLLEQFRSSWQTACNKEQTIQGNLEMLTREGIKQNNAAMAYAVMRREAEANQQIYMDAEQNLMQAGLYAGVRGSEISVVDAAREPVKPVVPNIWLYMGVTLFVGFWVALGAVILAEFLVTQKHQIAALFLVVTFAVCIVHAQAPTPSTSGLPTGVAHIYETHDSRIISTTRAAIKEAENKANTSSTDLPVLVAPAGTPISAPIREEDVLDISEYHSPEFHTSVRVSPEGTVTLPIIREVKIGGLSELQAAHVIEQILVTQGILLHPIVSVMTTVHAGQDVSVLGEVARPGVYPFTQHHRLMDFIAGASGLTQNAGSLINIFHRDDPNIAHAVMPDISGANSNEEHNPELLAGDTIQVSRAGLVYVVGDVIRPGGFPVDTVKGLTVVQAISLAWGTTQNASSTKAILIREQNRGRTVTTLNLKRMLAGQEPDYPIRDRDILFVPDSMAKNLLNKGIEAAIQSAIGVSIYSGLVYSQRF